MVERRKTRRIEGREGGKKMGRRKEKRRKLGEGKKGRREKISGFSFK